MLSQFEEASVRERATRFGVAGLLTGSDVATLHQNGKLIWGTYTVIPQISLSLVQQRLTCPISATILWLRVNLDLCSVLLERNLSSPSDQSGLEEESDV